MWRMTMPNLNTLDIYLTYELVKFNTHAKVSATAAFKFIKYGVHDEKR